MKVNEDYLTEEKLRLREGEEREQYNFLPAPLIYHSSSPSVVARQYICSSTKYNLYLRRMEIHTISWQEILQTHSGGEELGLRLETNDTQGGGKYLGQERGSVGWGTGNTPG